MLITAAPALIADAMPRAESAQVICSPLGSGTLSVAGAGPDAEHADAVGRRGGDRRGRGAVEVRERGAAERVMFEPAISGWVTSSCVSTTPISGLSGATGGSDRADDDGVAPARLRRERVGRLRPRGRTGSARRSRAARGARSAAASARARSRGDEPGAAGDPVGAVRAGDRARLRAARRRRSRSPGRPGRRTPSTSPGSVTRGASGALRRPAPERRRGGRGQRGEGSHRRQGDPSLHGGEGRGFPARSGLNRAGPALARTAATSAGAGR